MPSEVPVIDLADPDAPSRVDRACRDVGFFVVVGHGVAHEIVDAAWSAARRFFDLPDDVKLRSRRPGTPYGYTPIAGEALGRTRGADRALAHPDPKETFDLGPPMRGPGSGFGAHQRIWPTEPYELRPGLLSYYSEMEALAARTLELFACALDQDRDWFRPFTDRHLSALRLLHYPGGEPGGDVVRAGAHTDYGTFTLLRPDPDVGGLHVSDGGDGWLEVPIIEDSFVLNVGDLLHRWSNGRWRSTLHRVVGDPAGRRRSSIAYFHNPNWDAMIEPILVEPGDRPRYEPVQAGPWLEAKVARAGSGTDD